MLDWLDLPLEAMQLLRGMRQNIQQTAIHYLVVVAVFFALWLWWHHRPGRRARLQAKIVAPRQIRREILTSVLSTVVFGSVLPILFALGFNRYMHLYRDIARYGWTYFVLSIALMMVIQDTYFYWMHRLMHQRRLFRWFHRTHHLSTNTNPWTTYSVSPLEALVDSGSIVLILLLMPVTFWAIFIFSWINTAYAVYAHLGYELFPRSLSRHWLGRWINTSVAHNIHHAKARYNYGWYFLFWDRMMGTLAPNYGEHYRKAGFAAAPTGTP